MLSLLTPNAGHYSFLVIWLVIQQYPSLFIGRSALHTTFFWKILITRSRGGVTSTSLSLQYKNVQISLNSHGIWSRDHALLLVLHFLQRHTIDSSPAVFCFTLTSCEQCAAYSFWKLVGHILISRQLSHFDLDSCWSVLITVILADCLYPLSSIILSKIWGRFDEYLEQYQVWRNATWVRQEEYINIMIWSE